MKKLGYQFPKILLASKSPRRQDLLKQLGVEFEVIPVDIDESLREGENPTQYAVRVAKDKASAGLQLHPDNIILAADTIVVLDDDIFFKPADKNNHIEMLTQLSGRTHHVITTVALASNDSIRTTMTKTAVTFRELTSEEINNYWETGEPQDKSGGYASQGLASIFISDIKGSWSGVVGLPLYETFELLRNYRLP